MGFRRQVGADVDVRNPREDLVRDFLAWAKDGFVNLFAERLKLAGRLFGEAELRFGRAIVTQDDGAAGGNLIRRSLLLKPIEHRR